MYLIELNQIPNQTFTIMIENVNYRIELRTIQNSTYMSAWANGELLFYNQLCTPNAFVNPYNYVSDGGKFFFKCLDNEYPTYKSFGKNQALYFYAKDEVDA